MGSLSEKLSGSPAAKPRQSRGHWFVVESGLLNEPILYVPDPVHLAEAKSQHPGLVAYHVREVDALHAHRDSAEVLQAVHRIKKKFGGYVRSDVGA